MQQTCVKLVSWDPVDGSEILRSPVEVGSWNPIIYRVFLHPNGGWPWDFWTINSKWWPPRLGKTGNLHLFFSVWKLNWTSKMRTLRTQFTEQALQNVHAAIHVHMSHVLYDLSKEVENTYVFNFLSPRNGDSPRPFWRLEMHQSTLVTARWLVSWFEASTWDAFLKQKCLLFGSIDIACFTYHTLPDIGRWHMERYAAGLDA